MPPARDPSHAAPHRVLIVDDSPEYVSALRGFLADQRAVYVVGAAETGREGIAQAVALAADVVILDISLPDVHGFDVAVALGRTARPPAVVLVSSNDGKAYREAAREARAWFVPKCRPPADLLAAILEAASGALPEPPDTRDSATVGPVVTLEIMRMVTQGLRDVVVLIEQDGAIVFASDAAAGVLCSSPAELARRSIYDLTHPDDAPLLRGAIEGAHGSAAAPARLEARFWSPEGTWVPVLASCRAFPFPHAPGRVVLTAANAGEAREHRGDPAAESRQLRQIADAIDAVIWLRDATQTSTLYVNPAYERLWGRTCASLYAEPRSWLDAIHENDRPRVEAALASGAYDLEYRVQSPCGTIRWVRERARPILGADGAIARVAGTASDVTDRRVLEDRIQDVQTLDAVGRLAGGLAHDLNNMLAIIQLHSALVAQESALPASVREEIGKIVQAVDRASHLVRQLLTFGARHARHRVAPAAPVDVGACVRSALSLFGRLLGSDVAVTCDVEPDLPLVQATETAIDRIVTNLILNARDAMPSGGAVHVAVGAPRGEPRPPSHLEATAAWVLVSVSDTGDGIAGEHMAKIFEPFFSTKAAGEGTGLGLAAVQQIVRDLGGFIEVESVPAQGTTFRAYLPALAVRGGTA